MGRPFIKGLELSALFYREAVRPILDEHYPGLAHSAARLDFGSDVLRQFGQQLLRAHHLARQAVAHADRDFGWRGLAIEHDIEMGVERGDLVDRGHRQFHLVRQRPKVAARKMAVAVLDQVEILNQQVALARPVAEKFQDFGLRGGIELTSFGKDRRLAAAGSGVDLSFM